MTTTPTAMPAPTSGAHATRTSRPMRRTVAHRQGNPLPTHPDCTTTTKEVTPVQLTELIDIQILSATSGETVPCRENDAEIWFADTPQGVEFAKALCATCPARTECLAGALERAEPWGVWGGELFDRGVVIPRKRPRGRPRKSETAA